MLYACSLTRGVYLDLLTCLETEECLTSLKKFIGRRGRPERVYSVNGTSFIGAAKWVKAEMKDASDRLHNCQSTGSSGSLTLAEPHGGSVSSRESLV